MTRVALVTGASGSIGAEIAAELARRGWALLLHGRDSSKLHRLALRIKGESGLAPRMVVADFEDANSVRAMMTAVAAEARLDALINNAGTGFARQAGDVTDQGYDPTIQVNFLVPYALARCLQRSLSTSDSGLILNVCSIGQHGFGCRYEFGPQPRLGIAYGRSKLALAGATVRLADELKTSGIAVVSVHPGTLVRSALSNRLIERSPWPLCGWLARRARSAPSPSQAGRFIADIVATGRGAALNGQFVSNGSRAKLHRDLHQPEFSSSVCAAADLALVEMGLATMPPSPRAGLIPAGA